MYIIIKLKDFSVFSGGKKHHLRELFSLMGRSFKGRSMNLEQKTVVFSLHEETSLLLALLAKAAD